MRPPWPLSAAVALTVFLAAHPASARPPIRGDFFARYPGAAGTQLDDLASSPHHCGVCHYDFNGGGPRNPYGLGIQTGRNNGLTNDQAMAAIENVDSDVDGYTNLAEITDVAHFSNTPTFSGLAPTNSGSALNVSPADIAPYLVPTAAGDVTPPSVTVTAPNGGEILAAGGTTTVLYTATDASGVARVEVWLSDDAGTTFEPVGKNLAPTGSFSWFVPNLPGAASRIRVIAVDNAGNPGQDASDGDFTITAQAGRVPTTLRDMKLAGTQPFRGATLDDPSTTCVTCHGGYDAAVEPWFNWHGSMMGNAARDPLFDACVTVAEQDAPSVGDLCLRCHTPGGWQEGRSVDTSGGMLTLKDRQSVQCDFCHRMVDHEYQAGVSPAQDVAVLAATERLPANYGNGQFVQDPAPLRRGPYTDALAAHDFVMSPFHRSADLCGVCHDVSNPVFDAAGGDYAPNAFDAPHGTMNSRAMFPIERTFSEWTQSQYAAGGVYAPEFAGNRPDGMVSTCQDCHMADVLGEGCNDNQAPLRADLGWHDLTGGNTFLPDIIADFYPGQVDVAALQAGKQRAISMLQRAASIELTPRDFGVTIRVTNQTAHKLPSGYPEGRRIWLHVRAVNAAGQTVFESGAYDAETGILNHDAQAKVYEIHAGLSPALAGALGLPAGPSFHFVLNDTVYADNRIPPRGFTNAGFTLVQSPPVGHVYADGQHWDDTDYFLPADTDSVFATLYYQTTSKEYVEFLRDENHTNTRGQDLYDAWVAQGRNAPVTMRTGRAAVQVTVDAGDPTAAVRNHALARPWPNPFSGTTRIEYALPTRERLTIAVYDVRGRRIRELVNEVRDPGTAAVGWDGTDDQGVPVAAGVYLVRYETRSKVITQRVLRLR